MRLDAVQLAAMERNTSDRTVSAQVLALLHISGCCAIPFDVDPPGIAWRWEIIHLKSNMRIVIIEPTGKEYAVWLDAIANILEFLEKIFLEKNP